MRIAVTYEDGNIFQHFGHTESFKLYETEGGRVLSSKVIGTNGTGHEALAWLLKDGGVDALICGGMGQGAQDALAEAGIEVCAGQSGDADEAVEAFLRGELVNTGVNCDHHDHSHDHSHSHGHEHDHDCNCGDAGCSPGMCGGCSGCGPQEPVYMFEGTNVGKKVRVHYKGTLDDGTQFDSSYDRGQPLEFVCGAGQMIKGFDRAVAEMKIGDVADVHLEPEEAYGMPRPELIITVPREGIDGVDDIEAGDSVMIQDETGRPYDAVVTAIDDDTITLDLNHEMAGKALNFKIEMLEIS